MPKTHVVELKEAEREQLRRTIRTGKGSARRLAHARVLLKSDQGLKDAEVAADVDVSVGTVERVRKRYCTEGLEASLSPRPQPARPAKRRIDGENEARLVAIACSKAPDGHDRWTLSLLAGRMVEMKYVRAVSAQTVRRVLKKTRSSRG